MIAEAAPPFELTYEITAAAATAFHRHVRRRIRYATYFVAGAALVAAGLNISASPPFALALAGIAAVLLLLTAAPVERWFIGRRISKMPDASTTVLIAGDGIDWRDSYGSGRVEWTSVRHVDSTPSVVVLRNKGRALLWLPASAFADGQHQAAVVGYVRERAGEG